MKPFEWDTDKNQRLKQERNITFEVIVTTIKAKKVLAVLENPNIKKYPNQKVYVVEINNYAYIVPFIEDEEKYFLKTIFPSRKMTKKYIIERKRKK